jgi:DNA processing protein
MILTEEQEDILALFGVPGVGAKKFAKLTAHFGTPADVFRASKSSLMEVEGIGSVLAEHILSHDRRGYVTEQKRLIEKVGAVLITRDSDDYPPLLNVFKSAPPVLFVRGDVTALKKPTIAFVGTRKPSSYGVKMTSALVTGVVDAGMCVVSGMAMGIDATAHRSALDSGGLTVAVFGCGVDTIYPPSNKKLSEDIMNSGCCVSHFAMGAPCMAGNFPARNAVIVGLSQATVIVEAPHKSGALITADLTLRAGRKLFTVPGNIDSPMSEGTNALLAKGAHPVASADTILALLGRRVSGEKGISEILKPERPLPPGLAGNILEKLESGPLQVESLCTILDKPVSTILTELTMLEIENYVIQKPGKIFERL